MYQKTVLNNGIRVVTEQLPHLRSASMGVWIASGSRNEPVAMAGASHFLEHLLFKGTEKLSAKEIAEKVDAVGGQLNAYTGKEHTCFHMKVLDTHLPLAFSILGEMLLRPKLALEDVKKEREVILEEVSMYEDAPDEMAHDLHIEQTWKQHPLGHNILGTRQTLSSMRAANLRAYYEEQYTPERLVIAAAGNVEHQAVVALAQEYFGGLQRPATIQEKVPPVFCRHTCLKEKEGEQLHVFLSFPGISYRHPELYCQHLLSQVLGGGVSSRLFQRIREEKGLAYSVYSSGSSYSDTGLLSIYASTRPANLAEVWRLAKDIVQEMAQKGLSEGELHRAKEQLKGSIFLGLESSGSRMSRLGRLEISLGRHVPLEEVLAKIEAVTVEKMKENAAAWLDWRQSSLTVLGPLQGLEDRAFLYADRSEEEMA